jgi:membrane protein DedA with SNARE-associated domain
VSEDALCVFAGAASPSLPAERRATLVLCLYAGVVLSDAITFLIGRSLRMGIMDPVRRRMGPLLPPGGGDDAGVVLAALAVAGTGKGEGTGTGEGEGKGTPLVAPPGSSRMHRRLARCGDRIGFVTRLSVGVRGPLMLLAGFSGSVPFGRFALGSALGGVLSLSLQLLLGYWLRDHPGAVVGTVAGASTVVCAAPIAAAVLSGAALVRRSWKLRQPTAAAEAADLLDSR